MDLEFDLGKLRTWRQSNTEQAQAQKPTGKGREIEGDGAPPQEAALAVNPDEALSDDRVTRRERYRSRLIAQYHLDSEYIGVGQLARILGLSPSAIYGHMRNGRFFIPYRMFNAAPKIFIDDLVEWHCSGRGVVPAFGAKPWRETAGDDEEGEGGEGRALSKAEVDAAVHQAADDAMRSMGIDPFKRRGRRKRP